MHIAADRSDFEAGGKSIAEYKKASLIYAWRDVVKPSVGVGHAEVLGVTAIDSVTQLPAAVLA